MHRSDTDRNLLLGILALQMDFITRDALIGAMNAWVIDKAKGLGEVLLARKAIDVADLAALEPMVNRHVQKHADSPEQSLASLSSMSGLVAGLRTIADDDIQASLGYVGSAASADPFSTRIGPAPASDGPSAGPRYRKLRDHARGGLGVVYVAHDTELNREVALKEIQECHADDAESRSRFIVEAEVTGGLEHPGIVPVYGLGRYVDGRPFYAMRFIKGNSLHDAIQRFHEDESPSRDPGERALALQKLLRRFLDVCNAIAYAHSRGILHRDLKPNNVMVGQYGETLVVDWGLAKTVDRSRGDGPLPEMTLRPTTGSGSQETQAGVVVGTPQYMSPEQAAGRIDLLGPASDIYGLGATLYTLLVGRSPFPERHLVDILKKVQAGEFVKPREANKLIDPALEAVCLKAMALRPEDRYTTPKDLADDLELWIADEPVSVWVETRIKRVSRWAQRHRTLVASGVSLLATAVVTLAVAAVLINGARHEAKYQSGQKEIALQATKAALGKAEVARNEANQENVAAQMAQAREKLAADAAKAEAAKVVRVINVLVNTFRSSDPIGVEGLGFRRANESGKSLTALEILDRSARSVAENLKDEPDVRATLMDTIGDVYRTLLLMDRAEPLLTEALRLRLKSQGANSSDVATSYLHLGLFYMDSGKYDEAEKTLRDSLAIRDSRFGGDSRESLDVRFYLAFLHLFEDDKSAEEEFRRIVDARVKLDGNSGRAVGLARMGYAGALLGNRNYANGAVQGRLALRTLLNDNEASLLIQAAEKYQMGLILTQVPGQSKRVENLYRQALAIGTQAFGPDQPYTALVSYDLGILLEGQGRLLEAEQLYREGLDSLRRTAGLRHPKSADAVLIFADLLARLGRHSEGLALYNELIAARRSTYGNDHILLGDCLVRAAGYSLKNGDDGMRDAMLKEAIPLFLKLPRDRRTNLLTRDLSQLGEILGLTGQQPLAERFLREALPTMKTQSGARSQEVALLSGNLGLCLARQGKSEAEAEQLLADAVSISASSPSGVYIHHRMLSYLCYLKLRQDKFDEAEELATKALKVATRSLRDDPKTLSSYHRGLGLVLATRGQHAAAARAFEDARGLILKAKSETDRMLCEVNASLALARLRAGDAPAHHALVEENIKRFRATKNPVVALHVVWTSCRIPGAVADPADLVIMADGAANLGPVNTLRPSRSLARLRAGRFAEAVEIITASRQGGKAINGWDDVVLAIALKKLGRAEESEAALTRLDAWLGGPDARFLDWEQKGELSMMKAEANAH